MAYKECELYKSERAFYSRFYDQVLLVRKSIKKFNYFSIMESVCVRFYIIY